MTSQPDLLEGILACLDPDALDDLALDLDEIVHNLAEQDETIPFGAIDESDEVALRDRRSAWASDKNNQGAEAQIAYIMACSAIDEAEEVLIGAASSQHARLRLHQLLLDVGNSNTDHS